MTRFLLNNDEVTSDLPPGMVLLDFLRYHKQLVGTKIGCREGDCGACTILAGEIINGRLRYQSITCCLMALGNAHGKHIVTIEGINPPTGQLNPMQQAMSDAGATQCGFCTPGLVMSLAGFCLSDAAPSVQNAIAAIDGNICRCTGYKSIERAAAQVANLVSNRNQEDTVTFAASQQLVPSYFSQIKNRLGNLQKKELVQPTNGLPTQPTASLPTILGGGTDLYVQKHDDMTHAPVRFVFDDPELNGIRKEGNNCIIGPSATVSDLKNSPVINEAFPGFQRYAKLVSSTPIRNMATIAGNFINASPIGDFTIFFLALGAEIELSNLTPNAATKKKARNIELRKFYKGYKQLDKEPDEYITRISFELPGKNSLFHFEKVSKRTNLDIASVNSAIALTMNGDTVERAGISAGGVGPVPLYLSKTADFLRGKTISEDIVADVIAMAQTEISPISDARGTKEYKTFLLGQLIKAHFMTLFPAFAAGY